MFLYNGAYLDAHCCNGYMQLRLPVELRMKNIWFVSNVPVNVAFDKISSGFTGVPVRFCTVTGVHSLVDGKHIVGSNDAMEEDSNEMKDEQLLIAGAVTLQLAQTRKLWRHELMGYKLFTSDAETVSVASVAPAKFMPESFDARPVAPRCPWAATHPVAAVARQLRVLPTGVATIGYEPEAGIFEARLLCDSFENECRLFRIVPDELGDDLISLVECPRAHKRLGQLFPRAEALRELHALPRTERAWHRTPQEVVIAAERVDGRGALSPERVPPDKVGRAVLIATPPYIPALLTIKDTDDVFVHETAVVDGDGALEEVAKPPLSVMLHHLQLLVLPDGTKVTKVAQNTLRLGMLAKALATKFDSLTRQLTIEYYGFGLKKLFSLDIAGCLDVYQVSENLIGFTFPRCEPGEHEAESLADTLGFSGLAIVKRTKGRPPRTKYVTLAEPESEEVGNEIWYNLATETLTLRTGVRWWDMAGMQTAGVPLVPPDGRENDVYSFADGAWHAESELPTVTTAAIEAALPIAMDKKYR